MTLGFCQLEECADEQNLFRHITLDGLLNGHSIMLRYGLIWLLLVLQSNSPALKLSIVRPGR